MAAAQVLHERGYSAPTTVKGLVDDGVVVSGGLVRRSNELRTGASTVEQPRLQDAPVPGSATSRMPQITASSSGASIGGCR